MALEVNGRAASTSRPPGGHAASLRPRNNTLELSPEQRGAAEACGCVMLPATDDQIARLTDNGYREAVLTGVDLTSWGQDLPGAPKLGRLVKQILKHVPQLERLRLSSIDCIEADAELFDAIASEPRLMPHFHISAQAGDDMILKRMKRRHARAHTIAFCDTVRRLRPEAAFGADFIAGFPTETEEMFENTLRLVDEAGLTYLHVFPFSARTKTPAAKMPQLPRETVKERAARLRAKGDAALSARFAKLVGSTQDVLMETAGQGRTPCFAPVALESVYEPGTILRAKISAFREKSLIGHAEQTSQAVHRASA